MSMAARVQLVSRLVFQRDSQRTDLLDETKTQTQLIAMLQHLLDAGFFIELTAVNTDHHDDRYLQSAGAPWVGTHRGGFAFDCWPLGTNKAGDYLDASDPRFQAFLRAVAAGPFHYQTGLVGDGADSAANFMAAGPTAFEDDGGAHCHVGCTTA